MDRNQQRDPNPPRGARGTVVALLRVGTRRAAWAAALVAVCANLALGAGKGALAESRQRVLYLDAPSVSTSSAREAGEVARTYAERGVDRGVLAWAGLPTTYDEELAGPAPAPPPPEAEKAFASVTAPPPQAAEPGGLTHEQALLAGETMIAQLTDPEGPTTGSEEELATAGAVRPKIGDGTVAPSAETATRPEPGAQEEEPPAGAPDTQAPAEEAPLHASVGDVPAEPSEPAFDAAVGPVTAGYAAAADEAPDPKASSDPEPTEKPERPSGAEPAAPQAGE